MRVRREAGDTLTKFHAAARSAFTPHYRTIFWTGADGRRDGRTDADGRRRRQHVRYPTEEKRRGSSADGLCSARVNKTASLAPQSAWTQTEGRRGSGRHPLSDESDEEHVLTDERWRSECTGSLSHLRTMLPEISSQALPALQPNHPT